MKYFSVLAISVLALAACETRTFNTSQPLTVELVGVDEAYCILSTPHNRYAMYAPSTINVERTNENLKVDCTSNQSRRRVVTLEPHWEEHELYYHFPDKVTIDFSSVDNGNRYNGYRAQPSKFDTMVKEVVTEDSFSAPVETQQTYPVPRTHVMGRRSYPVPLN